jgi:hypothetical protein
VAYCALDRLVLIIHPLPRRLQLWEVLDAALDGDHAGILLDGLDLRRAMRWRHDGDIRHVVAQQRTKSLLSHTFETNCRADLVAT